PTTRIYTLSLHDALPISHRIPHRFVAADLRMLDSLDERTPFRTPQRFADAAHERRRDRRLLAARHPLAGAPALEFLLQQRDQGLDRKSTRLNSSHVSISY